TASSSAARTTPPIATSPSTAATARTKSDRRPFGAGSAVGLPADAEAATLQMDKIFVRLVVLRTQYGTEITAGPGVHFTQEVFTRLVPGIVPVIQYAYSPTIGRAEGGNIQGIG